MVTHIGQEQSFGFYLASYVTAVERLFRAVQTDEEPVDLVAPPLIFLMRHTLELGYKYTLWELHRMNGDPFDAKAYGHHRLADLYAALIKQYQASVTKFDLPDSEVENFSAHCDQTNAFQKQFAALDDTSFRFRYPIDKTGKQNFPREQTVDLLALKEAFDQGMILLRFTADVLGEYEDFHNWMEAEAYGEWY